MIIGDISNHRLIQIKDHPSRFYLTGSQFFKVAGKKSDWDFFTADTTEIRNFLFSIGFTKETNEKYLPLKNSAQPKTVVFVCGNIHIQLIPEADIEKKLKAQIFLHENNIIKTIYSDPLLDEETRKEKSQSAWETVFMIQNSIGKATENTNHTPVKTTAIGKRRILW